MSRGWIGVDLDGTLAVYDHWQGPHHVGAPVPAMVDRVISWLRDGYHPPGAHSRVNEVRIFTARVNPINGMDAEISRIAIDRWCMEVFGRTLPITHEKDFLMVELWDDRTVQVEKNTGRTALSETRPSAAQKCADCEHSVGGYRYCWWCGRPVPPLSSTYPEGPT